MFVNFSAGRKLRLRGVYAKVNHSGSVKVGDPAVVIPVPGAGPERPPA